MSTCKYCGKDIVWIQDEDGKWIPCDEGLVEYWAEILGPNYVYKQDGRYIRCRFNGEGKPTGLARKPHWATCSHKLIRR